MGECPTHGKVPLARGNVHGGQETGQGDLQRPGGSRDNRNSSYPEQDANKQLWVRQTFRKILSAEEDREVAEVSRMRTGKEATGLHSNANTKRFWWGQHDQDT